MKPMDKIYSKKQSFPKIKKTTPEEFDAFWDKMVKKSPDEKGKGFVMQSILGREVWFPRRLKQHLQKRNDVATSMVETLTKPDEVFTQYVDGFLQTSYIKYFQDYPYVLVESERNKLLQIKTFHPMDKSGSVDKKRKGILMYKK